MEAKSIVRKITSGIAISIFFAFGIALLANYWIVSIQVRSAHQELLNHQLVLLSNSLESPLWSLDDETVKLIADAYMVSADAVSLSIYEQGKVEPIYAQEKPAGQTVLYGRKDITHAGEKIGTVEIGLSNSLYTGILSRLLNYSIIVALLLLGFLFVVVRRMFRKYLSTPLKLLGSWTDQLANGQYDGPTAEITVAELNPVVEKFANMADKVQQREQALQISESRFRELADLLPGILYETDLQGMITYANQTSSEITLYTPDDIEAGLYLTQMLVAEDVERAQENIRTILTGESNVRGHEYTALKKDGTRFPLLTYSSPITKAGQVVGMRGIGLDISNSKRLEAELSQAHKMEAIGTMAGGIAHDFNNLLAIIDGNTEIIQRKQNTGGDFARNIVNIKNATGRATDLVRQILAFSRQDRHELEVVDLCRVVDESLNLLRSTIPASVEIECVPTADPLLVNADTTQIQQVVFNLCTNAVHAMKDKGTLSISLEKVDLSHQEILSAVGKPQLDCCAKLSVSDTGHGMDQQTLARIFDPFFTTKDVSQGTGMGLSVVHGIIDRHGGVITVDSSPAAGTSFHVYLPLLSEVEAVPDRDVDPDTLPRGSESILVVDDEECIAAMYDELLQSLGYTVTSVSSSREALSLFRVDSAAYDLVLTDLTMPELTGVDLAKELILIRPDIPIVLCSGYGAKLSAVEAKATGIREFCQKPVGRVKLAITIRSLLDESPLTNPA